MKTIFANIKRETQVFLLKIGGYGSHLLGKIHNPWNRKLITSADYREFKKYMKPGMVFLTRTKGEISNPFIPGFWKHAAIVRDRCSVIEAVGTGVQKTDLIDFLMGKDYVILLDPKFATSDEMEAAAAWAEKQIGKPYDYDIIMSDLKAFYCTELLYFSYVESCKVMPFEPRVVLGRESLVPSDVADAVTKFRMTCMSKSYKDL